MKRSDMHKLMVQTLLDNLPDLNNINLLDIAVYMETVLDAMEEAEMLPPPYTKELKDNERKKLGTNHCGYYTGKLELYEWEPEDEA